MTTANQWIAFPGRLLLALIFLLSAIKKIAAPAAVVAQIQAAGAPLPEMGLVIAVAAELAGAAMLILGWRARTGAAILAVFCFAAGVLIHWHPADQGQMIHFFKNLAIVGGLLQVVAFGAGPISLDARAARVRGKAD